MILGVKFINGSAAKVVEVGMRGGLVVVPSAPVLVSIEKDPVLRAGVLGADLAITDSGLMVLMWWLLKREKLERVSGLEYLKLLLEELKKLGARSSGLSGGPELPITHNPHHLTENAGGVFWVMPSEIARDCNLAWLKSQGHPTTIDDCYVAPQYPVDGELFDGRLLELIKARRPAHIIIALGGGVQERLGFALREALRTDRKEAEIHPQVSGLRSQVSAGAGYHPGIHCIGAAIGFLSGEQVRIPMWVDYLYLGWLWRSVSAPGKFVSRYWKAVRLVPLMWRYREKAPGIPET